MSMNTCYRSMNRPIAIVHSSSTSLVIGGIFDGMVILNDQRTFWNDNSKKFLDDIGTLPMNFTWKVSHKYLTAMSTYFLIIFYLIFLTNIGWITLSDSWFLSEEPFKGWKERKVNRSEATNLMSASKTHDKNQSWKISRKFEPHNFNGATLESSITRVAPKVSGIWYS